MTIQLDWLVHEPVRLELMVLFAESPRTFTEVMKETHLSKGNFICHARMLEAAGYLTLHIDDSSVLKGKSTTIYALTQDGRNALYQYIRTTQTVVSYIQSVLTSTSAVRFARQTLFA